MARAFCHSRKRRARRGPWFEYRVFLFCFFAFYSLGQVIIEVPVTSEPFAREIGHCWFDSGVEDELEQIFLFRLCFKIVLSQTRVLLPH